MAIQIYCRGCRSSSALTSKACPKCKTDFNPKTRKYRVSVEVKGKRVSRIVDNLTIAREIEGVIRGEIVRGEFDITHHKVKKTVTMNDLWEKYLPYAKEHKKTWRDDLYYYGKHLEPRFSNKALETITAFEIEKMKMELKKGTNARGKPYAAQTIKHVLVLTRRLFNLAIKWEMFQGTNPVSKVSMPKVDNMQTEFLTDDEASRLLSVLNEWPCRESAAFIKLAMFTGLRRGEVIKLKWNDVDFERGMVTLTKPKGGKTVTLPLSDEALDVLRSLEVKAPNIFPGKNGGEREGFKGPWLKIKKAASLPENFRFHGLRHHFASTLVSNGVDLAVVRELLSHKDLSMTARYAHMAPGALKAAAMESGKLLQPKPKASVLPFPG